MAKIEYEVDKDYYNNLHELIEMYEDIEEEKESWEYYCEQLEWLQNIEGEHEITSLQEYLAILEKLSYFTDGCYKIYNAGTYIRIGEDF